MLKTIKITIDKPILDVNSNLTHIGTSYRISRIPDLSVVTELLISIDNDKVNLLEYRFTHDLTANQPIYISTKYHFNNGGESRWSNVMPIYGSQIGVKLSDTILNTPTLTHDITYIGNNSGLLRVMASELSFFSGSGNHESTEWEVTTTDGRPIVMHVSRASNLRELTLPLDIVSSPIVLIRTKYRTDNNAESNFGVMIVILKHRALQQYYIDVPYPPRSFRWLYLNTNTRSVGVAKYDITLSNEFNNKHSSNLSQLTETPRIYVRELDKIRPTTLGSSLSINNNIPTSPKTISILGNTENTLVKYDNNLVYLEQQNYEGLISLGGITTQLSYVLESGYLFMMNNTKNDIVMYTISDNQFINMGVVASIDGDVYELREVNILPMLDGRIVIDYSSGDLNSPSRTPRFNVYDYNPISNSLTLLHTKERSLEVGSTAISGATTSGSDGVLYYIPNKTDNNSPVVDLLKYDINTDVISTQSTLPFVTFGQVSIAPLRDGRLLALGGVDAGVMINGELINNRVNNDIYVYDTVNDLWSIVGSTSTIPDDISVFHIVPRLDGKFVLFNNTKYGSGVGNQNSYVFDLTTGVVSVNTDDMLDGLRYTNTVVDTNGDIYRISSRVSDPQKIYRYAINAIPLVNNIDNNVVDVVTDLIVEIGQTVTIESPYRFDTITILGDSPTNTGTLKWVDGDIVHTFLWDDRILTRNTLDTLDHYTTIRTWRTVTLLDNVTLTETNIINVPDNILFNIDNPVALDEIVVGINGELSITTN